MASAAAYCGSSKKTKLSGGGLLGGGGLGTGGGVVMGPPGPHHSVVVRNEMCYFCFDVLYCYINNCDPPKCPSTISNDS